MDENIPIQKLTIVFKLALDDGVLVVAEVDQDWNWSGNPEYIGMLKMSILHSGSAIFPTRVQDLPRLYAGKLFWAEVKNE